MTRFTHEPTILAHEIVVGQMLEVNARPAFDGAPILKELVERYQNEAGPLEKRREYGSHKKFCAVIVFALLIQHPARICLRPDGPQSFQGRKDGQLPTRPYLDSLLVH